MVEEKLIFEDSSKEKEDKMKEIGRKEEESISNIYSGKDSQNPLTLFTDRKEIIYELKDIKKEEENVIELKADSVSYKEDEQSNIYSFLKNESRKTYESSLDETPLSDSDNNPFFVLILNTVRFSTPRFLEYTCVVIGVVCLKDEYFVIGIVLISFLFRATGQFYGINLIKWISLFNTNIFMVVFNILLLILSLNINRNVYCVFVWLLASINGFNAFSKDQLGNELHGFISNKTSKRSYKVENFLAHVLMVIICLFSSDIQLRTSLFIFLILNILSLLSFFFVKKRYRESEIIC